MLNLLTQIAIGGGVGILAFCLVKPLVGWWLERYRGTKHTGPLFTIREIVIACLVGIVTFMASFMGPLKSGGLQRAYNDLCTTISVESLTGVIGPEYAKSDTGAYLNGAFDDNCTWAE